MQIGIIGAGSLGTGLAKRLVGKGHSVMLSFSRDCEKLKTTANSLHAYAGTPAEAVDFADVVCLATPWTATAEALKQVGLPEKDKLLWDCTNALKPDLSGLLIGTTTSGGEQVATLAAWATVVKAIPPFAEFLHSPTKPSRERRSAVFICSDHPKARDVVARLVEEIGGHPVDAGPLKVARYAEPAGMLLVQLAYVQGLGPRIGFSLLNESAMQHNFEPQRN